MAAHTLSCADVCAHMYASTPAHTQTDTHTSPPAVFILNIRAAFGRDATCFKS